MATESILCTFGLLDFTFLCCRHVRGTPEKGGIGWRKDQINSHVIVYA